jgi:hypothetical protein
LVLLESHDLHHLVAEFVKSELGHSLENPDGRKARVEILTIRLDLGIPEIVEMLLRYRDVLDLGLSHEPNVRDVAETIVHLRASKNIDLLY